MIFESVVLRLLINSGWVNECKGSENVMTSFLLIWAIF